MNENFPKITMFAGQLLTIDEYINAKSLQKFIAENIHQGGTYLPLDEISSVLICLKIAGFLESENDEYTLAYKVYKKEEKIIHLCNFEQATPMYSWEA